MAGILEQGEYVVSEAYKQYDENLPFFMPFGTKDSLVSFAAGKEFYDKLVCKDKTFRQWDGLFHELHNEPEKKVVIQEYIDWITKHLK